MPRIGTGQAIPVPRLVHILLVRKYMADPMIILINKNAGSYPGFEGALGSAAVPGVVLRECGRDMKAALTQALNEGFRSVVAGGGDGTLHTLIQSAYELGALDAVKLGVLPLGTGNDFSRTLGFPLDPLAALHALVTAPEARLDVIRVACGGREELCMNIAQGGLAADVDSALDVATKQEMGAFAYLRGTMEQLTRAAEYDLEIQFDDGDTPERLSAIDVIVANGRTAGGGYELAPDADPADGRMDVFVLYPGSLPQFIAAGLKFLQKGHHESGQVSYRRASRVSIRSNPAMRWALDGTPHCRGDIEFELLPGRLRVLVGPEYRSPEFSTLAS